MKKSFTKFVHVILTIAMVVWSVAPGLGVWAKTAEAIGAIDTTAPTASITSPTAGSTLSGTVIITANASDVGGSGIAEVEFYHSSIVPTLIGTGTETTPGIYSINWDTTSVLDGNHWLYVNATDNAGNSTGYPGIGPVTVDNTAPTITGTFTRQDPSPYNYAKVDDTVRVDFVTSEFVTVDNMSIAGHAIGSYHPQTDNHFYISYIMLSSDTEGPLTYSLTGHDAVGNITTTSGGGVTFDKTAPAVTVPPDYIVEATSGSGAILNYVAGVTATDVNPATPEVTCVLPSGSTFPLGTTTVTCSATDSAGNIGTHTFNVTVIKSVDTTPTVPDTTNPVITLLGDNPATVTVGDTYLDAGATASDDVDGDITLNIEVGGSVDTNTVGTYTITYYVMDSSGNEANQVARTVNVVQAHRNSSSGSKPMILGGSTVPTGGQVLGESTTQENKFIFTLLLKFGSRGNEVMELQKFLNNAGYGLLAVDGIFGPLTKAEVIKFQIANGLVGDGIVGPLTRAVLNR